MKKIIAVIFVLIPAEFCHGAISFPTVWEFRVEATAGNVNGCGFNPANAQVGTDYSQQDGAQLTITDLEIDAVDSSLVSSVGTPFVDGTHEGNILHITAGTGFTAGWYEVVNVSVAGVATLDRSAGTVGSTGGTARLGGACSLNSTLDDDVFEALVPSNTVWVKSGNYSFGEGLSIAAVGNQTHPISIIGYISARNDTVAQGSMPVFNPGANNLSLISATDFKFRNLEMIGSGTTLFSFGTRGIVENCKVTNTSNVGQRVAITPSAQGRIIASDISSSTGIAISFGAATNIIFHGNYIHHSSHGISMNGSDQTHFSFNLFSFMGSSCVILGQTAVGSDNNTFFYNTFFGSETPKGVALSNKGIPGNGNTFFGNIFYGFETAFDLKHEMNTNVYDYNNYFNNTLDRSTSVATGLHDISLDPQFADWANSDFKIGTNLRAQGIPGPFGVTSSTGALDIGAVQRIEPAATPASSGGVSSGGTILRKAVIQDGVFR